MGQFYIGENVFDTAVERFKHLYSDDNRVVISVSGGKDSGICLELAVLAAKEMGRLPVEAVMRDEEIMFPGTFEYCERLATREEVSFHWQIANQPVINVFNRKEPYFWTFDPLLDPERWTRRPPEIAYTIPEKNIQGMVTPERFPTDGKLITVIGLRVSESINRRMGLMSSQHYMTTKPNSWGAWNARPVYDWQDSDVWKAIHDFGWDYNSAYDVMHRLGVHKNGLRIAPPTIVPAAIDQLIVAAKAWPRWFDTACTRLGGLRTAAQFGRRAVEPIRRLNETWKDAFVRICIEEAPEWISERIGTVMEEQLKLHRKHSSEDLPEIQNCARCRMLGSWKSMAKMMYMGDPFSLKQPYLPPVEPDYFRPGSGTWGKGKPTFS